MMRRTTILLVLGQLGAPVGLMSSCGGEPGDDWVDELEPGDEPLDPAGPGELTSDRHAGAFPGFAVEIAVDGDDVALTWDAAPDTEYHVYATNGLAGPPGAPTPIVGAAGSTLVATGLGLSTYTDEGAAEPYPPESLITFYQVLASGPAGDATSTVVAKVSTAAGEGYTKLGLCLLDGPSTASELRSELGDAVQSIHTWDETTQSWRWWWSAFGDGPFGDLALPFGGSVSVRFDETVAPYVTLVGTVPTDEPPLSSVEGLNILTTPITGWVLGIQYPNAGMLVGGNGKFDGVGRWNVDTQTVTWRRSDGGSEFEVEPCHAYYFEQGASEPVLPPPALPTEQVESLGELGDKGVRLQGIAAGDESGWAVDGAGDVNGDGYDDVIIGARGADVLTGEIYLVYGGPGLPTVIGLADADVRLEGIAPGDWAGYAVNGAGDVNGDGYDDVIIGAYVADGAVGESYLVYGGPSLPAVIDLASANVRLQGIDGGDASGFAVSSAGDVNADGYADLVVGAPTASPHGTYQAGEAYLVLGGPSLPAVIDLASADVRFEGIGFDDWAGMLVTAAGDVNGDGFGDVLLGAWHASPNGDVRAGESYLVYGAVGLPAVIDLASANVRFQGIDPFDYTGADASGVGDVNGDGYDDVLVGSSYRSPGGDVRAGQGLLVYGGPSLPAVLGLENADVRLDGIDPDDRAAVSVGGAGDLDADGYADLVIGANLASPNGAYQAGEAYVVRGGPALPAVIDLANADLRLEGIEAGDFAGYPTKGAGDVDGDGRADFLVGAEHADPTGIADAGETYLVYGKLLGPCTSEEPRSCKEILDADPSSASGSYTIYPDGEPMQAYCDMVTDGGGWTLVAKVSHTNQDFLPEPPGWFGTPLAADTLATPDLVLNAGLATQGASRFASILHAGSQARFEIRAADDFGQTAAWYKQVASAASFAGWFTSDNEPSQVCTNVEMTADCAEGIIAESPAEPGLVDLGGMSLVSYGYASYCGDLHMRLDDNFASYFSGICSCTLNYAGNAWHDSYQQHWGNALHVWLR